MKLAGRVTLLVGRRKSSAAAQLYTAFSPHHPFVEPDMNLDFVFTPAYRAQLVARRFPVDPERPQQLRPTYTP